jgi:hypothetical protein
VQTTVNLSIIRSPCAEWNSTPVLIARRRTTKSGIPPVAAYTSIENQENANIGSKLMSDIVRP